MFTQMLNAHRAKAEIEKEVKELTAQIESNRHHIELLQQEIISTRLEIVEIVQIRQEKIDEINKIAKEWEPRVMSTGQPITKKPKP